MRQATPAVAPCYNLGYTVGPLRLNTIAERIEPGARKMPIDLSTVNWMFVFLMGVFGFVAALLGSLIAFRNRFAGAVIAGVLFAVIFVLWNHYPHPTLPLPIISTYTTPAG
jgi:hypothetical protein